MKKDKGALPFEMYFESGEGVLVNSRFHESAMEIMQVLAGTVTVQIGTAIVEATAGEFIFVPPTMVFRAVANDGIAAVRGLVFASSILEANMENFDVDILYMFYVQSKNKLSVFDVNHTVNSMLRGYMQASYDELECKDVCYMLPIRANIYLMMTELLRYYCGSKDEADRAVYHNVLRLRPVINYIDEHYTEKIYVEKLSDMINVSPDYFTKMFKDSIGKTPIDYINGLRVNRAMQLLATTDTQMSAIAESVGFCNPNYFHKIFKQYMETSPLAYRKGVKA